MRPPLDIGRHFVLWVSLLVVAGFCPMGYAQCTHGWIQTGGYPFVDGVVLASVTWDPDGDGPSAPLLVVGGTFDHAGKTSVSNLAAWDGYSWRSVGGGVGIGAGNAHVYDLAVIGGDLVVAGAFHTAGGTPRRCLATWNGTTWGSLGVDPPGTVHSVVEFNGRIMIGGNFVFDPQSPLDRDHVCELVGDQWVPRGSFSSPNWYSAARELVVYDDELIARGDFTGSLKRYGDGIWQTLGSPNGEVHDLEVFNNELVVVGTFNQIGGLYAPSVARWNGSQWQGLGSGIWGWELRLGSHDDQLFVIGDVINTAGGLTVENVARWDGSSWAAVGRLPSGTGHNLISHGGEVLATKHIGFSASVVSDWYRWDGTRWNPVTPRPSSGVRSIAPHETVLALHEQDRITLASDSQWEQIAWDIDGDVQSMLSWNGDLVVAGAFFEINGVEVDRVARWDGSGWHAMGEISTVGYAPPLANFQGEPVVGESVAYNSARVSRWNGAEWLPLGGAFNGPVRALAVYQSNLYAGGDFSSVGGVGAARIAKWDGVSWSPVGIGISGTAVHALRVFSGQLYAAGLFSEAGGVPANKVARWNGTVWQQAGPGLQPVGEPITALATYFGNLFATGPGSCLPPNYNGVARWTGSSWLTVGGGLSGWAASAVPGLANFNGKLYVAGGFSSAGTVLSPWLAEWGAVAPTTGPAVISFRDQIGNTALAAVSVKGTTPLGVVWRLNSLPLTDGPTPHGSVISGVTTDTLTITNVQPEDAGIYDVVVSNSCGSVTSDPATLTVTSTPSCPADFDESGSVTSADITSFLAAWFSDLNSGTLTADFNGSGATTSADITAFLSAWFEAIGTGC